MIEILKRADEFLVGPCGEVVDVSRERVESYYWINRYLDSCWDMSDYMFLAYVRSIRSRLWGLVGRLFKMGLNSVSILFLFESLPVCYRCSCGSSDHNWAEYFANCVTRFCFILGLGLVTICGKFGFRIAYCGAEKLAVLGSGGPVALEYEYFPRHFREIKADHSADLLMYFLFRKKTSAQERSR